MTLEETLAEAEMKLTVFGATGRIGAEVVRQALDAGHEVTAVVRDPARLAVNDPRLEVIAVPGLANPDLLGPAVAGRDAVLSGVGPRRRSDTHVASESTRGILGAMAAHGVRRLIVVSAAPVGPPPADDGWLDRRVLRPFISTLLRDVYADLALMEREIRDSGVDWTVVWPPRLVGTPANGAYRTAIGANVPHARTISRAEVAHLMLAALGDPAMVGRPVGIAR
jgi:putative NADH-flavin reductase